MTPRGLGWICAALLSASDLLWGAWASDTNRPFIAALTLGVVPAVVLGWYLSVEVPRRDSLLERRAAARDAVVTLGTRTAIALFEMMRRADVAAVKDELEQLRNEITWTRDLHARRLPAEGAVALHNAADALAAAWTTIAVRELDGPTDQAFVNNTLGPAVRAVLRAVISVERLGDPPPPRLTAPG